MARKLFTITRSILAAAREYRSMKAEGKLAGIHVAECFPIQPETIEDIWLDAQLDIKRRPNAAQLELISVTVMKSGEVAPQIHDRATDQRGESLFG